ncbi:aminopeptidase [Peptostreptococcus equinus]|uniref:Aminopeptidase n=1 Tax=Peptostreptococcus equinus TaxID=3003601 RepID=A0ABY7JPZ3_9FIRM|nr:aminopeptidase [Peptostreptococcus sp. CBA3647]WAW14976.1 aminopeptidase [Peptostreptococcus sp. CBA3647]
MNLNERIDKFAQLVVEVGVNVKEGEILLIRADIEAKDFVRLCVKHAYAFGAKHVYVEYSDDFITREKYLNAPSDAFDEYPQWQAEKYTQIAKDGGSFLSIISSDPDMMIGVDPDRIGRFQKISGKYLKEWRSYTLSDKVKWSIVAAPSENWAKKVFPELDSKIAYEYLWESILDCSRVTENPIKEWEKHNKNLKERTDLLNELNFKELRYKSLKTNLTVGLPEGHIWLSGDSKDPNSNPFNPNIPTEEIFGMPHKDKVNGRVYSTKPLIYAGSLIDEFWIEYKNGKVVDFDAKIGKENLKNLIETDEGSMRLGEIALVPFDSPISNRNIIFYSTLFDENASCHLAIGAAYSSCIKNGDKFTDKEKEEKGVNTSTTHVDFMIGDNTLDIVGIKANGDKVQIFKNGNWAF